MLHHHGKHLVCFLESPKVAKGPHHLARFDLTADDILTYEPQKPVDIYGMAIGVKPGLSLSQKRLYSERLILGAKGVLLDLAKRGIIIHRIIAHSFTPGGIRLMKHIGFTETPPKAPALRDFMIDIESSGIPFLREYRKSLKYETILTGYSKKTR